MSFAIVFYCNIFVTNVAVTERYALRSGNPGPEQRAIVTDTQTAMCHGFIIGHMTDHIEVF